MENKSTLIFTHQNQGPLSIHRIVSTRPHETSLRISVDSWRFIFHLTGHIQRTLTQLSDSTG